MLLAVVSDPRLVLAQLAQQLVRLRHAKDLHAEARERLAVEARAVLAPLAEPAGRVAAQAGAGRSRVPAIWSPTSTSVSLRRSTSGAPIASATSTRCASILRDGAGQGHAKAQVYGRPKHIYSIYRKMERKHLAFEEVL